MSKCKFITTNPETFDFEQVCPNEGTGVHGWCEVHENAIAVQIRARAATYSESAAAEAVRLFSAGQSAHLALTSALGFVP
jgi:hypothetical protein